MERIQNPFGTVSVEDEGLPNRIFNVPVPQPLPLPLPRIRLEPPILVPVPRSLGDIQDFAFGPLLGHPPEPLPPSASTASNHRSRPVGPAIPRVHPSVPNDPGRPRKQRTVVAPRPAAEPVIGRQLPIRHGINPNRIRRPVTAARRAPVQVPVANRAEPNNGSDPQDPTPPQNGPQGSKIYFNL